MGHQKEEITLDKCLWDNKDMRITSTDVVLAFLFNIFNTYNTSSVTIMIKIASNALFSLRRK